MGKELSENKQILYRIHDYDPGQGTKNVHHIIFKSNSGTDHLDNLALIDKDTHDFIHDLIRKIDKNAK